MIFIIQQLLCCMPTCENRYVATRCLLDAFNGNVESDFNPSFLVAFSVYARAKSASYEPGYAQRARLQGGKQRMSLLDDKGNKEVVHEHDYSQPATWLVGIAVIALLAAIGGLAWCFGLQSHLSDAQAKLTAATQQNAALSEKIDDTNERMKAQGQALAQSVGLTQKELEDKTDEVGDGQQKTRIQEAQLARAQKATEQKVGAVRTDVSSVKTDVGGVKTDVATTKADLDATKTQLTRVMGDAGVMSGLIATNHSELEELKHKGDRNYLEFTLQKNAKPTLLSTVKLQLKKVDEKHARYTLDVSADDRNIEKKDKNLDEPVQFYTGKDPEIG